MAANILAVDRRSYELVEAGARQYNDRHLESPCDSQELSTGIEGNLVDLKLDVWRM